MKTFVLYEKNKPQPSLPEKSASVLITDNIDCDAANYDAVIILVKNDENCPINLAMAITSNIAHSPDGSAIISITNSQAISFPIIGKELFTTIKYYGVMSVKNAIVATSQKTTLNIAAATMEVAIAKLISLFAPSLSIFVDVGDKINISRLNENTTLDATIYVASTAEMIFQGRIDAATNNNLNLNTKYCRSQQEILAELKTNQE